MWVLSYPVLKMPNINKIEFIVKDGKVKYDSFGLMMGFPHKFQKLDEKEILNKIENYNGKTDRNSIGQIKIINQEYYKIEWFYPSKFEN